jgi:hypothetical protein
MPTFVRRIACAAILFGLASMAGCGSDEVQLGSVSGQVTKGGQPQANVWLEFKPEHGRPSTARTDANGRYTLSYTGQKPGALVGRHKVRLGTGGEVNGYGDVKPETELRSEDVEVKPGSNTLNFELK